jgi:hypothetical protein
LALLRPAFGSWCSRAYLILVAVVSVGAGMYVSSADREWASVAWLYVVVVTLPWSVAAFAGMSQVPADGPWLLPVLVGGLVVGALLNALLVGILDRGVRALWRRRVADRVEAGR